MDRSRPFNQPVNYALVLLLVSLFVYSSIGLTLNVSPAQAEDLPLGAMPVQPDAEPGQDAWVISFIPSRSP